MSHVHRASLPIDSRLHPRRGPGDFLDCFAVPSDLPAREAAEIIAEFPGWTRALVGLRNALVVPLGLRAKGPASADRLGLFPVEHSDAQEVVAGFDDKHLDFRISVLSEAGRVHLATWVHPHNLWGRCYLAAVMPFHILIARNALSRVARG